MPYAYRHIPVKRLPDLPWAKVNLRSGKVVSRSAVRIVLNVANPLRKDPTRTTMIRKRFLAEMARRFRLLKKHVVEFMVEHDALGLGEKKNPFITHASPREFQFRTDAGKVTAFQEWFQQQVKADIFSVPKGSIADGPWTAKYVESAYKQGQINAYLAGRSALDSSDPKFIDQSQAEFLRSSFNQPESISKVQLLATRSFEDLKGVTAQMGSNMNRILSQGMIDGSSPRAIAKEMVANIDDLTDKRALLIARTETIYAHAEGQLDAFTRLGVTELGVKAEWSTAGDDRVCEECAGMEGQVFDIEEAHGLIPLHPNCRCTWIPATAEAQATKEEPTQVESILEEPMAWANKALDSAVATESQKMVDLGLVDGTEHMTLLDSSGKLIDTVHSDTTAVDFPRTPRLLDPKENLVATHNHPDNSSFSSQDLGAFADRPGLKTVVAQTHDGTLYFAEPIAGKEVELARRSRQLYDDMVLRVREKYIFRPDIATDIVRAEYKAELIAEAKLIPQQLADEGLMKYSVEKVAATPLPR